MRADMFKVIVERPRRGVGYYRTLHNEYRAAKKFKLDEDLEVVDEFCGTKLPMRSRRLHWDFKQLNENLNPLRRYLEKQVGRPWNDIYSEVSKNLSPTSTVKQHVRDHLRDFVDFNVHLGEDGNYWTCGRWGGVRRVGGGDLFVDPAGVLRLCDGLTNRQLWREAIAERQRAAAKTIRKISNELSYYKINGIWFRVEFAPLPKEYSRYARDILGTPYGDGRYKYHAEVIAVSRFSASKVEILKFALN